MTKARPTRTARHSAGRGSSPPFYRDAPFDDELPAVLSAMVGGAQGDQRVRIVVTAVGAADDVVEVQKSGVPTTWDDATSAIASQDLAAPRPARPRGRRLLAPSLLPAATAFVANGDRDLVARATLDGLAQESVKRNRYP